MVPSRVDGVAVGCLAIASMASGEIGIFATTPSPRLALRHRRDVLTGRWPRRWGMSFSPEGECFGDRSIAMIVAGHAPRPSWYNARATQISRLLVLDAAQLVEIITAPGFEQFHKFIHRFGVWASFKVAFARAMREGGIARIADEWLAREQAAAAASKEEVPLDRRLDALEAKLDALLARTSSG